MILPPRRRPHPTRASLAVVLGLILLAACGAKVDAPPPAADEPAVLDDYLAITAELAELAEAHPKDRVATGRAMRALYRAHQADYDRIVARMRALYLEDLGRDEGERMPDRWPKKIAAMKERAERVSVFIQGPPYILRDEAVREVVIALAMSEDYASSIKEHWPEFGPSGEED